MLRETLHAFYNSEINDLQNAPLPSEGLPEAEHFFDTCKALQPDWRGLIADGGYYATPGGLEVWWVYAFGHTYVAFPELDAYYRWKGISDKNPIEKAGQIESYYWEAEVRERIANNNYI